MNGSNVAYSTTMGDTRVHSLSKKHNLVFSQTRPQIDSDKLQSLQKILKQLRDQSFFLLVLCFYCKISECVKMSSHFDFIHICFPSHTLTVNAVIGCVRNSFTTQELVQSMGRQPFGYFLSTVSSFNSRSIAPNSLTIKAISIILADSEAEKGNLALECNT